LLIIVIYPFLFPSPLIFINSILTYFELVFLDHCRIILFKINSYILKSVIPDYLLFYDYIVIPLMGLNSIGPFLVEYGRFADADYGLPFLLYAENFLLDS